MTLAQGSMLRIGQWDVEAEIDEISRQGSALRLEPRAMRVLVYLAERAGQIISVDELLENVWANVVVTPDSVYTTIAALRRALGDDGGESRYIVNVPRRGYRLIAPVVWSPPPESAPQRSAAQPQTPAAPQGQVEARAGHWPSVILALVIAVLLVLLGYLALGRPRVAKPVVASASGPIAPAQSASDRSIAVLPFVDMSEMKDQEYFAEGLAEEMIDKLAAIPDLKVPARTSSFHFKDRKSTVAEIARSLGVAYVLEGGVRKSGSRLRISVQLVRADSGLQLWSETYDRSVDEIFKVQEEVASAVARALQVVLFSAAAPHATLATNMEAYFLRQKARFLRFHEGAGGIVKAVALLDRATALDSQSAVTWAEYARAQFAYSAGWELVPWAQGRERVLAAARRALKLDDKLAEAYVILGLVGLQDWDWPSARAAADKAATLDPGSVNVLYLRACLAEAVGELAEAVRFNELAVAADPFNQYLLGNLTHVYVESNRLADAELAARKAVAACPNGTTCDELGMVFVRQGKAEAGLAAMRSASDERARKWMLAWAFQYLGRRNDADAALKVLEADAATTPPAVIARLHAMRGEPDAAFLWLDRAYRQHDYELNYFNVDPDFARLHADPRWTAFLRRMKLLQ
jgi:TolB-like protein/DNA-binding winged helix-turn-helix (wHTH) protein